MDLIQGDQPLPDSAFTASSVLGKYYSPSSARFDIKQSGQSGNEIIYF